MREYGYRWGAHDFQQWLEGLLALLKGLLEFVRIPLLQKPERLDVHSMDLVFLWLLMQRRLPMLKLMHLLLQALDLSYYCSSSESESTTSAQRAAISALLFSSTASSLTMVATFSV